MGNETAQSSNTLELSKAPRPLETSGSLILNPDGSLNRISPGARRILGISEEPEAENSDLTANAPGFLMIKEAYEQFQINSNEVPINLHFPNADEEPRHVSASFIPIPDGSTAISIRDETENDKLKNDYARLQQFASLVSHDLREPVRVTTSYLALLQTYFESNNINLDGKPAKYIKTITEAMERMGKKVTALYDKAQGRINISSEPKELSTMVIGAITNLEKQIEETKAQIFIDSPLPTLKVDSSLVENLFQNLIGNAVKYRLEDTPPIIHISAIKVTKESREFWEFSVQDNGEGIIKDHEETIFELFKRDNSSQPGLGIGLSNCKDTVEKHGGEIWVESPGLGQGSTFKFTLPVLE